MNRRRTFERIRALRERARSDGGAVAILTAILVPVFLLLTATAVDIGNWYVEAQQTQNAADAAATAGVTYLPQDPTNAFSQARATALANGYPNAQVTTAVAGRPSQLLVTVSGTVTNIFGTIFGNPTTTISRSAVADYTAPAIMGSPCNAIGNQPPSGGSGATPYGTVIPPVGTGTGEGGYTTCQTAAQFWMNIAGPATNKGFGDRYATQTNCGSGIDFCTGGTNDEYREEGYFLAVRVQPDAVNQPISLQLYDPAFVYTGDTCEQVPPDRRTINRVSRAANVATIRTTAAHGYQVGQTVTVDSDTNSYDATAVILSVPTTDTFTYANPGSNQGNTTTGGNVTPYLANASNPFAFNGATPNAAQRYALNSNTNPDAKTYCTGDQKLNSGDHLTTSFLLRGQTDSQDPLQGVPIAGCNKQYGSWRADMSSTPGGSGALVGPTQGQLTELLNGVSNPGYFSGLAQTFHQWVDFCTFTPTTAGDYYLQVRTNVPLGGTQVNSLVWENNAAVLNAAGTDTSGSGHNRFAVRAYIPGNIPSGTNAGLAYASQVSVAGYERMPIYANASATSARFNLIQVLPNAAGQSFFFTAYDNGDATCPTCTITVALPADAASTDGQPLVPGTCTGDGPVSGDLTGCSVPVSSATHNGKVQTISVPIPANYTCAALSVGGCWYTVTLQYGGNVSDTTTWDATIGGDPVRLIR